MGKQDNEKVRVLPLFPPKGRGARDGSSARSRKVVSVRKSRIPTGLMRTPEVDLEKVHRLRWEIQEGLHKPDLKAVADRIIAEILLSAGFTPPS